MKQIVMIGPAMRSQGGVAAVVKVYRDAGLFRRWPIVYLDTYAEGSAWIKLATGLTALRRFFMQVLGRRVAMLHAHTGARSSFWRKTPFFLLAFAASIPVIFHLHDGGFPDFYWKECGLLRRRFVRFILRRVAYIVVVSPQWRALIAQITPNSNVIDIVNPILAPPRRDPQLGEPRSPATLLFLGWLIPQKGVFDLLQSVVNLRASYPRIQVLFGGNRGVAAVEAKAKELGIADHVKMLGWIDGEEKQRVLSEATLYVLPSYREGLPMGVLEAMAAGLPIVASDVGGIPDVVTHGIEGYLVKPGNVADLTQVISALLADPARCKQMGSAGKLKVADCFVADRVLPRIDALYRALGAEPIAGRGT